MHFILLLKSPKHPKSMSVCKSIYSQSIGSWDPIKCQCAGVWAHKFKFTWMCARHGTYAWQRKPDLQPDNSASKSKQILSIGLWMRLVLVFTKTLRTSPFGLGRVFTTRPKGLELLGPVESTMTTMSFSLKFLLVSVHFCHCCSRVRYSVVHHFQKRSTRYYTYLHRLLVYKSSLSKSPGSNSGLVFNYRRWFGVSASRSLGSMDMVVISQS